MECAPTFENSGEKEYDREAVRAEAVERLDNWLESMALAEGLENMPAELETVAKINMVLKALDTENFSNDDRHLDKIARERLEEELGNVPQKLFTQYQMKWGPLINQYEVAQAA